MVHLIKRFVNRPGKKASTKIERGKWCSKIEQLVEHLEAGDKIEVYRGAYSHWMLCTANDREKALCLVAHVCALNEDGKNILSLSFGSSALVSGVKVVVKEMQIGDALQEGDFSRVNNDDDKMWPPRSIDKILAQARSEVGKQFVYDVAKGNCGHFVNRCRHGVDANKQFMEVVIGDVVPLGVVGVAVVLGAVLAKH